MQLVVSLDAYEADTARMVANWPDLDLYRSVSDQVEQIRMQASALPEARVQWVELLIAHAELVHLLWQAKYGDGKVSTEHTAKARGHHTDVVAALRNRSLRIAMYSRRHDPR